MSIFKTIIKHLNNTEEYLCTLLLTSFVILLFLQIVLRQFFQYSIPWGDEVATYMFVWFAFLGASVAAKMSAHNRVSFQFSPFPAIVRKVSETFADFLWIVFNLYFVYLSYDFVFNKMNLFWKSQTTGIPMKYFYMILPLAFTLMTLRILWCNYERWFKDIEVLDPEQEELKEMNDKNKQQEQQEIVIQEIKL